MRLFAILIFLALLMWSEKTFSQDLESFQGENRILLLKDTNLESDWLKAQLKRLKSNDQELIDREVLVLLLSDECVYDADRTFLDLKADAIIEKYNLSNFEGLILIGKDGGAKLKEEFIVSPLTIFNLIDSMPMRILEMQNKN